jgi:hypothetical protein
LGNLIFLLMHTLFDFFSIFGKKENLPKNFIPHKLRGEKKTPLYETPSLQHLI